MWIAEGGVQRDTKALSLNVRQRHTHWALTEMWRVAAGLRELQGNKKMQLLNIHKAEKPLDIRIEM